MAVKALNPYLHFDGTAQQALALYETALGATADCIMRYSDGPMAEQLPEALRGLIMHAQLRIDGNILLLSDTAPGFPAPEGGNGEIMLDFTDVASLTKACDELAAGGTVVMAPEDTFWGARFGVVIDRFGVRWALHCTLPGSPQ